MKRIEFLYPQGKTKALTFSYDDGNVQDIRMIEILRAHGMRGTFNLNSGSLLNPQTWPEEEGRETIRGLSAEEAFAVYEGQEVAVHGMHHPYWSAIPRERAMEEIAGDKRKLEEIFGRPVRGMACPFGSYDEDIRAIARAIGMRYVRRTGRDFSFCFPSDPLYAEGLGKDTEDPVEWLGTCSHTVPDLMRRLADFLVPRANTLAVFCLKGHSYEFAKDHNWQVLEEFCAFAGGRQEVWYPTCIEIFDYHHALKKMIFTADCSLCQNPSAISVWMRVESDLVEVRPGETLAL